ncbi:MAG: HD domain-containing protein [Chloroflexi bacterium]|nr:HD domain-containing protein [Chloroflexota bacterium]
MALKPAFELRDPVHGLIRLTEQELAIVSTPPFQRLRRIRQLAMADLVYPGALHTRFEHSLGTLHVASRILARLAETNEIPSEVDERVVRLAALLHDIGHGPFSHVSEYLLDRYYDPGTVGPAAVREKIHEKITMDIIGQIPAIAGRLDDGDRELVIEIIRGGRLRDYRRDIVSSNLDADKMDYLLRDAYFAGVRYGWFDLDKIIESFLVQRSADESFLMVAESGVFAVEQLIVSKHHMTQQVYAHRVRAITDAMIVRGLELALSADERLQAAYRYDGTAGHLARYLELDDARVSEAVLQGPDPRAREIFRRLRERRLYKEVALIPLGEVPNAVVRNQLLKLNDDRRLVLEEQIAELVHCEPWQVIVHRKTVKNPAYQDLGGLDPEEIYYVRRNGVPAALKDHPELVMALHSASERIHVIAPHDPAPGESRELAKGRRAELEDAIRALVYKS